MHFLGRRERSNIASGHLECQQTWFAKLSTMAEILGAVAGSVSLLSEGIKVTESLIEFYQHWKNQDAEQAGIVRQCRSIQGTFTALESSLIKRHFGADEQDLKESIDDRVK